MCKDGIMKTSQKPQAPVHPEGMEILFFYPCPHCGRHVPQVNPVTPQLVGCDACGQSFPIVPIDERSLHYVRIMLANGRAAVDPDFL